MPRPGEVSLAHNGVLFLDEITEFRRDVLEVLRQPLESGRVVIARAAGSLTFPARFQLVAAANPCPCGHLGDPRRECRCTPPEVRRYRARLSGPLLDRIDLQLEVPAVPYRDLARGAPASASAAVRARVLAARAAPGAPSGGERAARQRRARRPPRSGAGAHPTPRASGCWSWREQARAVGARASTASSGWRARSPTSTAPRRLAARHVAEAIAYRTLDRVAAA